MANCSPAIASESARIVLGCYRKGEAEDAEIYVRAIAAILGGYPESVVRRVADPRIGIAGWSQWLPTVAEIRSACEREMEPIYAAARAEARARERQALPPPGDAAARPSREDLEGRYPDLLGGSAAGAVDAAPPDYSGRPCALSPLALRAIGLRPKGEPAAERGGGDDPGV